MSEKKTWINDVGTINKSKNGNLYINIDKGFSVNKGDRLVLKSKKQEILDSAEAGRITQERAEELLQKLEFIKYTIHVPPSDND
jgi:hypothetical protein